MKKAFSGFVEKKLINDSWACTLHHLSPSVSVILRPRYLIHVDTESNGNFVGLGFQVLQSTQSAYLPRGNTCVFSCTVLAAMSSNNMEEKVLWKH